MWNNRKGVVFTVSDVRRMGMGDAKNRLNLW